VDGVSDVHHTKTAEKLSITMRKVTDKMIKRSHTGENVETHQT